MGATRVPAVVAEDATPADGRVAIEVVAASPDEEAIEAIPAACGLWRVVDVLGLAAIVLVGLVARFATRSPMWLDEALTVDIARLPISQIPGALRHDGHPPLYYVLLHLWMQVVGTSDAAIRSLAGVFGVLTLPATWCAARRLGGRSAAWLAVVLFSVMPFAVRYSSENRMYSLMMLLCALAWLALDRLLQAPSLRRAAPLALLTGLMLWTHYWALWLGAATAVGLGVRWIGARRQGRAPEAGGALWALGALAAGFLTFLPWVPTLLYQGAHTGTPWAARSWPTTVVAVTIQDLGGGGKADAQLFGWSMVIAATLGVLATAIDRRRILVDVRGAQEPRRVAVVALGTLALATVVGVVTNSAFQARYNAAWMPLWVVLAGLGLLRLRGPVLRRVVLAVIVVLAVPGSVRAVVEARSQSREIAHSLARHARSGDAVVLCPDQLGPSLLRELHHQGIPVAGRPDEVVPADASGLQVVGFPGFTRPDRIDWVDYVARLSRVSPKAYAREVSDRYAGRQIFVVWDGTYRTHEQRCENFVHALNALRPISPALVTDSSKTYEHAWLVRFGVASS